jgi:hypothetical protein
MKPGAHALLVPLAALNILLAATTAGRSDLAHRYSFTADAKDSVGNADGTLQGNATISNGAVVLDGSQDTYVNLPGGLISNYQAVTLEAWATFATNTPWARVFDFGGTDPNTGNGMNYLFLTAHSGAADTRLVISDADPGSGHEETAATPQILDGLGQVHLAAVVDPQNQFEGLYINGALAASINTLDINLSAITNQFSYLGKSLYSVDPFLIGSINEFRVYDRALSSAEIASSYGSGPDTPRTDPGALQSISLQVDANILLLGFAQATVLGTYANATNAPLANPSLATYQSSAPSVITVDTNGLLKAVGLGSATITTTFQGKQDSKTVKVFQPEAQIRHRYSFSDPVGSTNVQDSVGTADGALVGGASLSGNGMVTLDGTDGYVNLPNGIISSLTNATFEAWVNWAQSSTWQRIFDFGSNSGGEDHQGTGQTYLFLTPQGGTGVLRFAATVSSSGGETPVMDAHAALPLSQEVYVAVVYNVSARQAKLFLNGVVVATNRATIPLKSIKDVNNWLGRSQWNDPYFNGQIDEFRIHEGALTDFEVALSAAAGPDKVVATSPGDLNSLTLAVTNTLAQGALVRVPVLASYANVQGVDVSANENTSYQSSDPSVLVVATDGTLDALSPGQATLTATYLGKTATQDITVTAVPGVPAKAVLVHRYSFDETSGTTAKDSVGTADGTVVGTATFGGGKLTLSGGAVGSTAGYVDLPNGMISALTNATFEIWATWKGGAIWQRLCDFGNSTQGEDQQGTGDTYFFISPRGGNNVARFAVTLTSGGAGEESLDAPVSFVVGQETHIAVTYNSTAQTARMFINGKRVGWRSVDIALSDLNDINNWLGRSQWNDPFLNGVFDEFRIYSGTLSDAEVAADYAAGPDLLGSEVQQVSLTTARSGNGFTLSWPASATGFVLESSSALGPQAAWASATEQVTVQGTDNTAVIQPGAASKFYRLHK